MNKKIWLIKIVIDDNLKIIQQKIGDFSSVEEVGILDILRQRAHEKIIKKLDIREEKNGRRFKKF
jgi:hypothetical protein